MILTTIDFILTVTRDDLPPNALTPWTQAAVVSAAVMRKHGARLTETLSNLGWGIKSESNSSVELCGVCNAMPSKSAFEKSLLDSCLWLLGSAAPANVAELLDWWWANACTVAQDPQACVAVLDVSGNQTVVALRSVSLPAPTWGWLVRAPSQASITWTQLELNPTIYEQIEADLAQKSSGLTDRVRTVTIAQL